MIPNSDISFVIPAKIDSPERSRNLDLAIAFIMQHFESPVFVQEAGEKRRYFPKTSGKLFQYQFVEDRQQGFNHTKCLNLLYEQVTTPIMAIWDTDAIVPPKQLIETANQIRKGKAVMGLPYDGSMCFVTENLTTNYEQTMNLKTLTDKKSQLRKMNGRLSVGGAILVDRVKYMLAGGDNEYFTDWGPEDLERVKRMEILYGKPIYRHKGYLYHLWHPRGNSQYNDPQKEILFKQEYLKICSMRQKELKSYVATWPWNIKETDLHNVFMRNEK